MAAVCCESVGSGLFPSDAPSPLYTMFSVVVNVVGGVWALIVGLPGTCCASTTRAWVFAGAINSGVNVLFPIYLFLQFRAKIRGTGGIQWCGTPASHSEPADAALVSASRVILRLFMYDWGVCAYLLVLAWQFIWFLLAVTTYSNTNENPPADDKGAACAGASDSCANQLNHGAILLVVYVVGGCLLLVFTLATECCAEPRWIHRYRAQHAAAAVTGAAAGVVGGVHQVATTAKTAVGRLLGGGRQAQNHQPAPAPVYQQQQPYAPPPGPHAYAPPPSAAAAPAPAASAGQYYAAPPPRNPAYQPQYQQ